MTLLWFLTRNCSAVFFGDKPLVHSKYGGKEGVCFWPRRVFGELPAARGRSGAATVSTSSLTVPFQKSNKLEFSSRLFSSSTVGPPSAREWVANVQFSSGDHPITTQTKLNWPNDVLPKLPLATTHKGHVWRTGIQNKWYLSRSLPAYAPSKYIQWVLGNFMLSNFCFAFVSRIYHISLK